MANTRIGNKGTPDSSLNYEEATVDTDPGANGYACEGVCLADLKEAVGVMSGYIKVITGATVHLQWKRRADSTWTDHGDAYTTVQRFNIYSESDDIFWRLIVKDNNQGTTSTFGIDW